MHFQQAYFSEMMFCPLQCTVSGVVWYHVMPILMAVAIIFVTVVSYPSVYPSKIGSFPFISDLWGDKMRLCKYPVSQQTLVTSFSIHSLFCNLIIPLRLISWHLTIRKKFSSAFIQSIRTYELFIIQKGTISYYTFLFGFSNSPILGQREIL